MSTLRSSLAAHLSALAASPLALFVAGGCGDSCVAAGTRVATPRGWLAVETLRVGDAIYAVDVAALVVLEATISAVRTARRECLALTCEGGRTLVVTPDHPVFAPTCDGFVEAGRLALGQVRDVLLVERPDGEARPRVAATGACRTYVGVHDVYDLSVAGAHPTFIAEGFVVHNKTDTGPATTTTNLTPAESSGSETAPTSSSTGTSGGAGSTGDTGDTGDTGTGAVMFPCGPELVCDSGAQYCEEFSGGAMMTIDYTCQPLPDACLDAPSCQCLADQGVFGDCSTTPEGGLFVRIAAP